MLEFIKDILEHNAILFLVIFVISLVANVLQILSYMNDRKRMREDLRQRKEDTKQLAVYEFLFQRAEKQVMSETELKTVEEEVSKRSSAVSELEKRIGLLRQAAAREVVSQNIDRNIAVICDAYEELKTLRAQNAGLGALPDLPEPTRIQIEEDLRRHMVRPYELPKSLAFRCLLLVLLVMLLPSPVDNALTVVFLHVFLIAFFQTASLSQDSGIAGWVMRNRRAIGVISAMGVWYFLLQLVHQLLARPLDTGIGIVGDMIRLGGQYPRSAVIETILNQSYRLGDVLLTLAAVIAGVLHWRAIRWRVEESISDPLYGTHGSPASPDGQEKDAECETRVR